MLVHFSNSVPPVAHSFCSGHLREGSMNTVVDVAEAPSNKQKVNETLSNIYGGTYFLPVGSRSGFSSPRFSLAKTNSMGEEAKLYGAVYATFIARRAIVSRTS